MLALFLILVMADVPAKTPVMRGVVVERFTADARVSVDLLATLESEVVMELGRIKGCELSIRAASQSRIQVPRPALLVSGEVLEVRDPKILPRESPAITARVRFRDLDSGALLHEEVIRGGRFLLGSGGMEIATRGFARSLATVTRRRFFP